MSRNIPVHLRHKQRPAIRQAISRDIAVTGLRIGIALGWVACLTLFVMTVIDATRGPHGGGAWLVASVGYGLVCAAALVVGWRAWKLRQWACIATVVAAWLLCLGEPWRPAHYPGEIIDPMSAIGAGLMAVVMVAAPLTYAWYAARSQLKPGL